MSGEPENTGEIADSGLPMEVQKQIDDLNYQITLLDARDQINSLKAQVKLRTDPVKPVPRWKHFSFIQHLYLGWKNGDAQEKTKYASTLTLILAIAVTGMAALSGHVSWEAAAALNILAGGFGKIGDWLATNYSTTNFIPNSTYTYEIPEIEGKSE